MQGREKIAKSRNTVFFQWFVAPEGRKVGSLKRRVRSQLARWVMKNCTPLWREARFGALLEVEILRKCTPLWREAHFEVKMYKAHHARSTFGSWDDEKRTPLWREAHVQVNMLAHARTTVEGSDVILLGKRKGFCTLPKVRKREDFVAVSKTMAGVGHFKRFYKDAFRVAGAVQETCSSEMLGGQGRDFLRGVALWSIRSSGL